MLYDFSLNIGDTINLKYAFNPNGKYVVDSVSTRKMLDNTVRKYLHLREAKPLFNVLLRWIEGIGDIYRGLLYNSDFEGGISRFICHKENNVSVTYNPNYNMDCDSLTYSPKVYVPEDKTAIKKAECFYNIEAQQLVISNKNNQNRTAYLINITGQIILFKVLTNEITLVSVDEMPVGIYILKIIDENYNEQVFRICKL